MNIFLDFSDAAKFADLARNILFGHGYNGTFSFWNSRVINLSQQGSFPSPWIPPLMPFSIAGFFKIFGVGDLAVVATSFFYFLLTLVFVFLLARKVSKSSLVGILSTLAIGFNNDLINYATSGASESPFIFEIVAASYFISVRKKWATAIAVVFGFLMYFTRPFAFIYIAGLILYWLLLHFKIKKTLVIFVITLIAGFLVDYFVMPRFAGKYFLYSVTDRGIGAITQVVSSGSPSDSLRGVSVAGGGILSTIKKLFYNLYNFYKLAPQILNPYLLALFIIGLFKWGKDRMENSLKVSVIFMVTLTLLVTALSIPFFRYIHPIVPFVYIIAVGTIVEILSYKFSKKTLVIVSILLVIFFGVGQTLGVLFLDSRFERNTHNVGKLPAYVELAYKLRDNTGKTDTVLTNLDTWGSWYGERRTVWYPVEPKQIIDPKTGKIPFDAIYLTSYLIDDQNYYMGVDWRLIFFNPEDPKKWTCDGCQEIAKEFKLKGTYKVAASEDYERQDASAVLLIKK